ncbi:endonuclease/exonuclease/phosphatase family protein [Microvirga splendida]|uniref:Endonuclease/exonuclease/phosphatase family protein n=1 Tax=Microvirga splendida TaxID=2795727 RepID=A0ABS0Y4H7_9HYPH|nr:endonuclease/exonuclease/phosphatase family protein [Microvirga splendida]MBJ6126815.1 endonuclease/exonuclease/phosphatase family protein [Microvirga splendida]
MRILFSRAVDVGLSLGSGATVAGLLAPWWPALELINHFRPFLILGAGLLLALALGLHAGRLAATAAALLAANLGLMIAPALRYTASAHSAAAPTLKVATLNTWIAKGQASRIRQFIAQADADVLLLQEIGRGDRAAILDELASSYPHALFDRNSRSGPALLSKQPWTISGSIPTGQGRPLAVWARFERDGHTFEVASVHTANPFEWHEQAEHIDRLIAFARSRRVPLILGGDFNLTPFSWKLIKLAERADLRWGQSLSASWPGHRMIPIVLLDHILVSRGIATVRVETGPFVGSDHLPIIADLVLEGP